jgi:hypothetical protein
MPRALKLARVKLTRVTMRCEACGCTARRDLQREPGSRGTHETCAEPAYCPRGHGRMVRVDGVSERWRIR